jgi:hypothetical protein
MVNLGQFWRLLTGNYVLPEYASANTVTGKPEIIPGQKSASGKFATAD